MTEPWPARLAIIGMVMWGATGYNVLIMLGGLQGIPSELYDAASVDGANTWQKFFQITVPMMRGVILFVAITSSIGLLNLFTQPWLLFQDIQGRGPDGSTNTLNTIQYATAFSSSRKARHRHSASSSPLSCLSRPSFSCASDAARRHNQ